MGSKLERGNVQQLSRRDFVTSLAAAAALGSLGRSTELLAQAAEAPKPPADPAGTVANAQVLAEKVPQMRPHSDRPLTASVTAEHHNFDVTPNDRMFIRNNLLTPDLDAVKHRVTVTGLVDKPLAYSLEELQRAFPVVTTRGMLECAGAGRTAFAPRPSGTPWPVTGGMGCPQWRGVRLRDVLRAAGLKADAVHVSGQGGDFGVVATAAPMIRSIPISKAMEEHTLIAFEMNGGPLPKIHGYPLRLVVPGWVGSASVKWLHTLTVLDAPFKGPYMDGSYRIPRYPVKPGDKMPPDAVIAEAWPVKSMITAPAPDSTFKVGKPVLVQGRAWVGEGAIDRVDVSFDEGSSWQRAAINSGGARYAWRIFSFEFVPRAAGYRTVLARATDDRGNAQPITSAWNPLGYFWNAIHRVGFMVEA